MRGHELVASSLADLGVDTIFGLIGHGNMLFVDDLVQQHDVRYVHAAREDGAVMMADGYARSTGRLGVATVTFGPGLTNTLTALTESSRARTPMLLIAGDTPRELNWHRQAIDQASVVRPSGALFRNVSGVDSLAFELRNAVREAWREMRPVVINIAQDIQEANLSEFAEAEVARLAGSPASFGSWRAEPQRVMPEHHVLDRALGVVASAKRPLILVGRGGVLSEGKEAILELAERLGALTATTLAAKDYLRSDPGCIGTMGTFSHQAAISLISQCDVILAFGASMNRDTTGRGAYLEDKTLVMVDSDPSAMAGPEPALEVLGDARSVAEMMNEALRELDEPTSKFRSPETLGMIASSSMLSEFTDHSGSGFVDVRTAMIRLDTLLPSPRTIVVDAGRFMMAPLKYLSVDDPRSWIYTSNFGSIGLSLAAGIGAAVGTADLPTVVVCGDGGLLMSMQELHTIVRNELDLIVVVVNDGAYGAEFHGLVAENHDPSLSFLNGPDFPAVAHSLGLQTHRIDDITQFDQLDLRDRANPILIEIAVDPQRRIGFAE